LLVALALLPLVDAMVPPVARALVAPPLEILVAVSVRVLDPPVLMAPPLLMWPPELAVPMLVPVSPPKLDAVVPPVEAVPPWRVVEVEGLELPPAAGELLE
jgi:hypothetical protein